MSTTGVEPHAPAPVSAADRRPRAGSPARGRSVRAVAASAYPHWFYLPAGVVFGLVFVIPTLLSFYFSRSTRWTLFTTEFIGLGTTSSSSSRSRR